MVFCAVYVFFGRILGFLNQQLTDATLKGKQGGVCASTFNFMRANPPRALLRQCENEVYFLCYYACYSANVKCKNEAARSRTTY